MADLADKLDQASARLEMAAKALAGINTNQSTISINAGGLGLWVACTCCVVMLACNLFLVALYVDQQQQIRDLDAYLSAIYMQAPHLKPEDRK